MIEHLVFFKLKPEVGVEAADAMIVALRGLKTKVPSVVDLSAGKNFSTRAQGYGIGLTVRFRDAAGLEAYAVHPEHQAFVTQHVKLHAADVIAVDYEF